MISISHPVCGEDFVNRADILSQLKAAYPLENVALVGPRRMGKSSIADQFLLKLEKEKTIKFRFKVHGNMGTPGKFAMRLLRHFLRSYFRIHTESLVIKVDEIELNPFVLIDVANQIKSKTLHDLSRFLTSYYPPSPDNERAVMERILIFLDEFSQEMGIQSAIVLDEFQDIINLGRYKGFRSGKLLAFLESIFSDQKKVWYMFTGSAVRMIVEILEDKGSPFYGRVKRLNVGNFTRDDTLKVVYKCTKKSITGDAYNLLFSLSGGHPFYAVVLTAAASIVSGPNAIITKQNIEEAFVSELSGGALDSHCNYLFETSLGRVKSDTFLKELLRELTSGEATQAGLSGRLGRSAGYLSLALRNLVNLDLIVKRKKKYHILDHALEIWLASVYGQNEPRLDIIRESIKENHIEKIAALSTEIGIYFESYMRELLQKFNGQKYGGIRLPRFDSIQGGINTFDESGEVFGKPSNIEIDSLCMGDENWICEFKYRKKSVTEKDINTLIRKKNLVSEKMKIPIHKIMYVANFGFCEYALNSDVWCLTQQEINKLRSVLNLRKIPSAIL